jgi:hypothetical protein
MLLWLRGDQELLDKSELKSGQYNHARFHLKGAGPSAGARFPGFPQSMNMQKKIWWLLPAICSAAGLVAALLLWNLARFHWSFSIKEGFVLAGALTLTTSFAFILIKAYPTKVGILPYAALIGGLSGAIGAWLHGVAQSWLLLPVEELRHAGWLHHALPVKWVLYPALLLLYSITLALYRRMDEIESRYALQQDAAALLKEAELFKLRQQLQPHFLYNSLNAVSSLIITSPDKAGEMISRLADFLRASVRQGRSDLVSLEEELDYLRSYLWIEAVRFGDRLNIEWTDEEIVTNAKLPPFLLQPVMENAIRFGVYGKTDHVTIGIGIQLRSGMLHIIVTNPYDPSMKAAGGTGFGLEGIRRRLYLMYARQDLVQTTQEGGYFTTTIQIPQ